MRPNHLKQNKKEEVVTTYSDELVDSHSARYVTLHQTLYTSHEALGNRASGVIILENDLTEGDIITPLTHHSLDGGGTVCPLAHL